MLTTFASGRLFGRRFGSEPAQVLAMHGWGGDNEQLRACVEHLDAISLDLPGFGASPAPDSAWGAADYAAAVEPVLDGMAERVVLVGFSFGGRVAVHLALRRPQQVSAMVLTGAPLLRPPSGGKSPLAFRLLKQGNRLGLVSDERMEAERRKRGSADYRNATGVMRDVLVRVVNESYGDELGRVSCPVEMVWGEQDTAAPLALARQAAELNQGANLIVVPGADHFLPVKHPSVVQDAIRRVLS